MPSLRWREVRHGSEFSFICPRVVLACGQLDVLFAGLIQHPYQRHRSLSFTKEIMLLPSSLPRGAPVFS